jgi:copper resistance protein C
MKVLFRAVALAALVNFAFASHAWAHAHLKSTSPADKSIVAAPTELDLEFSEGLNEAFSGAKLIGPDKQEITLTESMLMNAGKVWMATVPVKLAPGVYTVEWHALAVDGHKTNGSYSFTVKP